MGDSLRTGCYAVTKKLRRYLPAVLLLNVARCLLVRPQEVRVHFPSIPITSAALVPRRSRPCQRSQRLLPCFPTISFDDTVTGRWPNTSDARLDDARHDLLCQPTPLFGPRGGEHAKCAEVPLPGCEDRIHYRQIRKLDFSLSIESSITRPKPVKHKLAVGKTATGSWQIDLSGVLEGDRSVVGR